MTGCYRSGLIIKRKADSQGEEGDQKADQGVEMHDGRWFDGEASVGTFAIKYMRPERSVLGHDHELYSSCVSALQRLSSNKAIGIALPWSVLP